MPPKAVSVSVVSGDIDASYPLLHATPRRR
jgi:hypothetical protein